jgi:hypothetical protein
MVKYIYPVEKKPSDSKGLRKFKGGDLVNHSKFGVGKVVDFEFNRYLGGVINIKFKSSGQKSIIWACDYEYNRIKKI